jgi:diguanylate cyclase (GGDEF)-like protein
MLTDAQWDDAQRRRDQVTRASAGVGLLLFGVQTLAAMLIASAIGDGLWRYPISIAAAGILGLPMIAAIIWYSSNESAKTDGRLREMSNQLNQAMAAANDEAARRDSQVSRQKFESRLTNALDMAEGEREVFEVVERSVASVLPDARTELLLADNSHAHLVRMAAVGFDQGGSGCPVESPDHCPAARRAQVQVFPDRDDLDACPKLRRRGAEHASALCIPVSIMGRTVGVIHSTQSAPHSPPEEEVGYLSTLAKLTGARIGLMRAMAESQLQASTDTLTGLLNRRSFEEKLTEYRRTHHDLAVAMADLDHFKELNDTYGHETGDRALRLFARVLQESVRADDLLCRYGGEEFAMAFPSCSAAHAERALQKVRARIDEATAASGLPRFTASFGVTEMPAHGDLATALSRADTALFTAKREGRDRVVLDPSLPAADADDWVLDGPAPPGP